MLQCIITLTSAASHIYERSARPGQFPPCELAARGAAFLFGSGRARLRPLRSKPMNKLCERIETAADHSALLFLLAAFPAAAAAIIAAAF